MAVVDKPKIINNTGVYQERFTMELGSFIDFMIRELGAVGPAGVVICLQTVVVVLWGAYQRERKRCAELVNKMFEMSHEATVMIERITGR